MKPKYYIHKNGSMIVSAISKDGAHLSGVTVAVKNNIPMWVGYVCDKWPIEYFKEIESDEFPKPPFVFPSGVGQSIGKAFKTREGNKVVCCGDYRVGLLNLPYPILCACAEYNVTYIYTREGLYDKDPTETHALDIIGYWEETSNA